MTAAPRAAATAIVAIVILLTPILMADQQDRQARVYVAVVDADGQPVTGLTSSDFKIRENGEEKEVLSAGPATEPLALALMTDGLGGLPIFSVPQVRTALKTMVGVVRSGTPADSQVGLMRFDGAAVQQVKLSGSAASLDKALSRLTSFPGSSVLLEAIGDTCPSLSRHPSDRRVILAIVAGYKSDTSQVGRNEVQDCLRASGASLWALEAVYDSAPIGDVRRDFVLLSVTQFSGGMHVAVSTGTALEAAALRMATVIVSQYAVVYGPPGRVKNGRLEVFVRRPDVRVIAPVWTSR